MNKLEKLQGWATAFWAASSTNEAATHVLQESSTALMVSTFDKVRMFRDSPRAEPNTVRTMRQIATAFDLPFTEAAFTMLALPLMASSPAVGKMYLVALKVRQLEKSLENITVPELLELLDNRIIGPHDLEASWRAQKGTNPATLWPFASGGPLMEEFYAATDFQAAPETV